MNTRRITIFAMLAAFTIIVAVAANFILASASDSQVPPIVLPPELSADGSGPPVIGIPTPPDVAEITPENLTDVVLSLSRPDTYNSDIEVQLFWDGGAASLTRKVWVTEGAHRIHVYDAAGFESEHRIIAGDLTYVWQEGSKQYSTLATGDFSADDAAFLPTYEHLASVAQDDIRGCGYVVRDGLSCLYAETVGADTTHHWWVALDSGLLYAFESWQDGAPTRIVRTTKFETGISDRSQFILPDGNSVIE